MRSAPGQAASGGSCSNGYCDRPAVAAVYVHGSILIRPDHVRARQPGEIGPSDESIERWRCLDCLHDDIDLALAHSERDLQP